MALARNSQMLQASFCLLALVAISSIVPSCAGAADSESFLISGSAGRTLLQAPAEEVEDSLDDLGLPTDPIALAPSPLAEAPASESPLAESPISELVDSAMAPAAEGPSDADLEELVTRELDGFEESDTPAEELPTENSAGAATMGTVVVGVLFSAAIGLVL